MARPNPVAGLALGDFLDRPPVVRTAGAGARAVQADAGVVRAAVAGVDERTRVALLATPLVSPAWFPVTTAYARVSERRHPSTAHVLDLLPAYLLRRLRPRERGLVVDHLDACPGCDRVLRELRDLPRAWAALGDTVVVGPPEQRPERVPGRLPVLAGTLADVPYAVARLGASVRPVVWGGVAAALVLGGAGAVAIGTATAEQRGPEVVPAAVTATRSSTAPAVGAPSASATPSEPAAPSAAPSPSGDVSSPTPDGDADAPGTAARDDDAWRPTGGTAGETGTSGTGTSGTGTSGSGASTGGSPPGSGTSTGDSTGGGGAGAGQQAGGGATGGSGGSDGGGSDPGTGSGGGGTGSPTTPPADGPEPPPVETEPPTTPPVDAPEPPPVETEPPTTPPATGGPAPTSGAVPEGGTTAAG